MKFKYIVIIFGIILFLGFFLSSDLFQIKAINVTGNKHVSKEEIIRLSNLFYGQNIFRINKKQTMKNIFENPYVKMIRIKRVLPASVNIDIIEREPIARVSYVGSFINIDEDGFVLEISNVLNNQETPVIEGLKFNNFKVGEILNIGNDEQLKNMVKVIKELKLNSLLNIVLNIDVSSIDNIRITTRNGTRINIGTTEKLSYKIAYAKKILEDLSKNNKKGTIEMRYKDNPIFIPE